MKTNVTLLIDALTTERDSIDRAIKSLKMISGGRREASEAAAVVKPRKRRRKLSAQHIANMVAGMAKAKADRAAKANGQAGQSTSASGLEAALA